MLRRGGDIIMYNGFVVLIGKWDIGKDGVGA